MPAPYEYVASADPFASSTCASLPAQSYRFGAVVLADLAQIDADAKTHQDSDARWRILFAVERLRQIAQADLSSDLVSILPTVRAILDEKTAPIPATV